MKVLQFIDLECIIQACKSVLVFKYEVKGSLNQIPEKGFWEIRIAIQSLQHANIYRCNRYRTLVQIDNKKNKKVFVHNEIVETIRSCNLDSFDTLHSAFQKCKVVS